MLPLAAIYLIYQGHLNKLVSLGDLSTLPLMVMIGSGAATTIPLLFLRQLPVASVSAILE